MPHKIKRDAFLYEDPQGKPSEFAQCGSCRMRVKTKDGMRCSLHGPDVPIDNGDSCGLYVFGSYDPSEAQHMTASVTTLESGFVSRPVRCENCAWFDPAESECELFEALSQQYPAAFDLDPKVDAHGCCNAQTPLFTAKKSRTFEAIGDPDAKDS